MPSGCNSKKPSTTPAASCPPGSATPCPNAPYPPVTYANNADGTVTATWGSMTIKGTRADVDAFINMCKTDMGATTAGRTQLQTVLNDTAHPTTYLVGRSQPNVVFDSFGSKQVDLDDLDTLPHAPPSGHPNASTRGEFLSHFINERHHNAVNGGTFGPSHAHGITTQNAVRNELGQSPVVNQVFAGTDSSGNTMGRTNYADGTSQTVHINNNGDIVSTDLP